MIERKVFSAYKFTENPFRKKQEEIDNLRKENPNEYHEWSKIHILYDSLVDSIEHILNAVSAEIEWANKLLDVLKKNNVITETFNESKKLEEEWLEYVEKESLEEIDKSKLEKFCALAKSLYDHILELVINEAEYKKYGGYTYKYGNKVKEELDKAYSIEDFQKAYRLNLSGFKIIRGAFTEFIEKWDKYENQKDQYMKNKSITARLDRIALELEQNGALSLALAVDQVSDRLERVAMQISHRIEDDFNDVYRRLPDHQPDRDKQIKYFFDRIIKELDPEEVEILRLMAKDNKIEAMKSFRKETETGIPFVVSFVNYLLLKSKK